MISSSVFRAASCQSGLARSWLPLLCCLLFSVGMALLVGCGSFNGYSENLAPTITAIADQFTTDGTTVGPLSFTVWDAETPTVDLSVTASSGNTGLVPNGNITLGGSGADRTVTLTPAAGQTGTAEITLVVTNAHGATALSVFLLTVVSGDTDFIDGSYLIIDISGGSTAPSYPSISVTTVPEDLLTNADYKTNKIVLRRIPAGTFMMGAPAGELGRWTDEDRHQVTLTQDFYIGVFQVTQRQWLNVMGGSNPSTHTGDTRPVETVSWNEVRGGMWAGSSGGAPASTTFMGRLATRTGIAFDLPTEAQWEYAARAGTTTALNSGQNLTGTTTCINLNLLARYDGNRAGSEHAAVGSYLPNVWGLYNMHGNVWEWCLDWYQASLGTTAVTDPVGPTSGFYRVERGGGWRNDARLCRSASRSALVLASTFDDLGFRLAASGQTAGSQEESPTQGDG